MVEGRSHPIKDASK